MDVGELPVIHQHIHVIEHCLQIQHECLNVYGVPNVHGQCRCIKCQIQCTRDELSRQQCVEAGERCAIKWYAKAKSLNILSLIFHF